MPDWISALGLLACFAIIVILVMPNCTPGKDEDYSGAGKLHLRGLPTASS